MKHQVSIQGHISNHFMVRKGSLALAGNVPSYGVTVKILFGGNLKNYNSAKYFAKRIGMKEKKHVKNKEPWWKSEGTRTISKHLEETLAY